MGVRMEAKMAGMRRRSGAGRPLLRISGLATQYRYDQYDGIAMSTPTRMHKKMRPIWPRFMPYPPGP